MEPLGPRRRARAEQARALRLGRAGCPGVREEVPREDVQRLGQQGQLQGRRRQVHDRGDRGGAGRGPGPGPHGQAHRGADRQGPGGAREAAGGAAEELRRREEARGPVLGVLHAHPAQLWPTEAAGDRLRRHAAGQDRAAEVLPAHGLRGDGGGDRPHARERRHAAGRAEDTGRDLHRPVRQGRRRHQQQEGPGAVEEAGGQADELHGALALRLHHALHVQRHLPGPEPVPPRREPGEAQEVLQVPAPLLRVHGLPAQEEGYPVAWPVCRPP
mmetsp:Transcript_39667/g.113268  ORF Transcript_39667/g.113268 Transcript_39667/m.113268 type:complete len:272 (+) Transcript_39667:386-1201(+)